MIETNIVRNRSLKKNFKVFFPHVEMFLNFFVDLLVYSIVKDSMHAWSLAIAERYHFTTKKLPM